MLLQYFVQKYQFQSITYLEFRLTFNEAVRSYFPAEKAESIVAAVDWDGWVKKGGANPPNNLDFSTEIATEFA